MAKIALKVDVDTLRGTREGVPNLARVLEQLHLHATFLFSLGPDHTGWALKRIFRPGFLKKVGRTSVLEHYGIRTLLYGVLLPGPDIGQLAYKEMQAIHRAGHETGIHAWDHVAWHDGVRNGNAKWTLAHMQRAYDRFQAIFRRPPSTAGAAGWQMNEVALQQLDTWSLKYASDGRAPLNLAPYRLSFSPESIGEKPHQSQCIQYPTTLPTLDELIGVDGMDASAAVRHLLSLTQSNPNDQVFTLHAELEGQKLLPAFVELVEGWLLQGHQLVTLGELHQSWVATQQLDKIATCPLNWGTVPNRSGELMVFP